jgi:hypothetical protein
MTDDTTIVEFGAEGQDPIPHIRAALAGYEMDDKNVESVHVEITLIDAEPTSPSQRQSNDANPTSSTHPQPIDAEPGRIHPGTREHWALTLAAEYLERHEVETFRSGGIAEANDLGKKERKSLSAAVSRLERRKDLAIHEAGSKGTEYSYSLPDAAWAELDRLGYYEADEYEQ